MQKEKKQKEKEKINSHKPGVVLWPQAIQKLPQESGIWQGGALNLSQALPAPKQLNLNKLSDADGSQMQRLPTQPKPNFSGCLGIHQVRLICPSIYFLPFPLTTGACNIPVPIACIARYLISIRPFTSPLRGTTTILHVFEKYPLGVGAKAFCL